MKHDIPWMIVVCVLLVFALCALVYIEVDRFIHETLAAAEETSEATVCTTVPIETTPTTEPEVTETVPEATEPPVMEETLPDFNQEEVEMLACVIYQEAGGDMYCDECRRRVADVVLNRVNDPRFPNNIYAVLTAPNQYGNFHWDGIRWPSRAYKQEELHAVARAYQIAREVLGGHHSDLYGEGYVWQAGFVQGTSNIYHCGHFFGK